MEQAFSIQATGAAFETLSSRLYSNPILAIIRELSSNAHDAHVMAENDEPFNLHLPTQEEPFFNIRDYGTGIPEDQIFNIYTSFFMSTKTDSENQIGAFGLGSKTPFALVDEYIVTSFYDGREKVYRMSKINGAPTVEKIKDVETNEHNGLNIYFNYRNHLYSEYNRWAKEAINFFEGTSFMPVLNIEDQFDWDRFAEYKTFYTNNSVKIGKNYSPTISVNVAGVKFSVDINDLKGYKDELENIFSRAGVSSINILSGKSDVTITPSRETLHYDEKTINYIHNRLVEEINNYYSKIEENIDNIKYFDAIELISAQSWNLEINNKLKSKIENSFFDKALFCYHSGRGAHVDTVSPKAKVGYSWRKADTTVLVDFNGIKSTVKQNVIDNFLSGKTFDEDGKLTSTSFINVIKKYKDDENVLFLFPKDYKDTNNLKACKDFLGESVSTVRWADICEVKKPTGEKRKVGFKTRNTQTFINNNGNYESHWFYGSDPDVKDGETALIVEENINNSLKDIYIKFCLEVEPSLTLVIRPCKDTVFNTLSNKGYSSLENFTQELAKKHLDEIKDTVINERKRKTIRRFSYYGWDENICNLINSPEYDELEEISSFKTLRELYKEEVYKNNCGVGITGMACELKLDLPTWEEINFEKDFPLCRGMELENVVSVKNYLDYMLLYKNSNFYQKKTNEQVA